MNHNYAVVFPAVLTALSFSACDRPKDSAPAAVAPPPVAVPASPTGATGSEKSISSIDSSASSQSGANPAGAMTKHDESVAMPKPGQANDHSSPALHPPK